MRFSVVSNWGNSLGALAALAMLIGGQPLLAQRDAGAAANQVNGGQRDQGVANSRPVGVKTNGQGRGVAVKSSKTRMHFNLDAAAGLDTNPYTVPNDLAQEFAGDMVLRLRPGFSLSNKDAAILWDTGFSFDWGMMPGFFNESTQTPLLYHADAHGGLEFNRGAPMSFAIRDSVAAYTDPGQVSLGALQSRINNELLAGFAFKPGGGALVLRTDYSFGFQKYIDPPGYESGTANLANGDFDSMRHYAHARLDWRFFPRTGAFVDVRGGANIFPFSDVNPDSYPLWVRTGLLGQFTRKSSGVISLGYANPFVMDTPTGGGEKTLVTADFPGIVGHLEYRWFPNMTTQLAGGIKRDVSPAAVYQYVANSRAYGQFQQKFGRRMTASGDVSFGLLEFGDEQYSGQYSFTTKPTGRLDYNLGTRLELGYSVFEWMSIGIMERFAYRFTDASMVDATSGAVTANLSSMRNELFVIASVRY